MDGRKKEVEKARELVLKQDTRPISSRIMANTGYTCLQVRLRVHVGHYCNYRHVSNDHKKCFELCYKLHDIHGACEDFTRKLGKYLTELTLVHWRRSNPQHNGSLLALFRLARKFIRFAVGVSLIERRMPCGRWLWQAPRLCCKTCHQRSKTCRCFRFLLDFSHPDKLKPQHITGFL
jgi:hypothetical protein